MTNPLRLLLSNGASVLAPADPLSSFKDLQARLPELLQVSQAESETIAFYSYYGAVYPMTYLISQTYVVRVRILLPRFSGILYVYTNNDLRIRHFISIDFYASTPVYRKMLFLLAYEKLENDCLLAINELNSPLVEMLMYVKFATLINKAKGNECPYEMLDYIRSSYLRQILLGSADEFFVKMRQNDYLVGQAYDAIETIGLPLLATLSRFTNLLIPAAELECYNSGYVVRQLTARARNCYLSITYNNIQKLGAQGLEVVAEMPIHEYRELYCYADCIVFSFSDGTAWTFATANSASSYEECKQYIALVARIRASL